ncbi:MAG: HlyD family efflux transporter periplasmic adaptor subunit, partial [Desulfobulbaceae bacterium]|nr:HlyD family efflux transporter periplasmic adaptor subunit [Desulfobulbaceae bacterium]
QLTSVWINLVEATSTNEFCWNWLWLQCHMIVDVKAGMVLLGTPGAGTYAPAAVWPDSSRDLQHLVHAAESALGERQGVVTLDAQSDGSGQKQYHIAYPLDISGKLYGVVVLEVSNRSEFQLQEALRQLHWGMAWLETIFRRQEEAEGKALLLRLSTVLELVATVVQPGDFLKIAMELVNAYATRLHCQRVSLGYYHKDFIHLVAISNTAQFDKKTNLAQAIESAMEEALDQNEPVLYPAPEGGKIVARLHEDLSVRFDCSAIYTVPLPGREDVFGALTFERQAGSLFSHEEMEQCKAAAHLLGPILEMHHWNDQWFGARMFTSITRQLEKFFGPRNVILKTLGVLTALALIFICVVKVEYRITAKTVLEGSVQRVVAVPFDGFLLHAEKRAGDVVSAGETLCLLDDRDLLLEKSKWNSEAEQYRRKYQESMATHDRAAARVADAQVQQAKAEIDLLDEKLSKAKISAPFDGIVVSGDLSQRLGMPVRLGDELFTLAPLDQFRVILQVDEREISNIINGSSGALILTGMPQEKQPFVVKRITPVSTAEGGRNYFRVEATLQEKADQLRPGMEGIGKIESGKRTLVWIWTHSVIDWFRLWIWSWWL